MAHEIIFHNYAASPFSEKVRLVFGMKGLAWRSVEIPSMLPKPLLVPLTGGYRKTPVMQIGADIFCDTQIIIRELERRFPDPSLFPHGKGLPYALGFWSDRPFFLASVPIIFGEIGAMVPEDFKKDRAAMSGGTFSIEALQHEGHHRGDDRGAAEGISRDRCVVRAPAGDRSRQAASDGRARGAGDRQSGNAGSEAHTRSLRTARFQARRPCDGCGRRLRARSGGGRDRIHDGA
jgi:hypothetical protein